MLNRPDIAHKHEKGFSLIEALLAMTILAIAATGVMATFSGTLVAGRTSQDFATSAMLMDDLRSYLRSGLFMPTQINQGAFTNHPDFQYEVLFTQTEIANFYQVDLTITWMRGQRQQNVSARTYHYDTMSTTQEENTTSENGEDQS